MKQETLIVMQKAKDIGLNVVGCHAKKYAHRTTYNLFLSESLNNDVILLEAKKVFKLTFDFIQESGYKYKHGANKILCVEG